MRRDKESLSSERLALLKTTLLLGSKNTPKQRMDLQKSVASRKLLGPEGKLPEHLSNTGQKNEICSSRTLDLGEIFAICLGFEKIQFQYDPTEMNSCSPSKVFIVNFIS